MQLYQIPNEVTVMLNNQIILTVTNSHQPFDPKNKTGGFTIAAPHRLFGNFPDVDSVNKTLDALENDTYIQQLFGLDNTEINKTNNETWNNPQKLLEFIKKLENTQPTGMAHSLSICTTLSEAHKRLKELQTD